MTLKCLARTLAPHVGYLSPAHFAASYLAPQRPGHFPQLVAREGPRPPHASVNPHAWRAVEAWRTPGADAAHETLAGMRNDETENLVVPVEVGRRGRGYMDTEGSESGAGTRDGAPRGWQSLQMPFGIFLDAFVGRKIPWSSGEQELIGYMAQHDLLSAAPRTLAKDCPSLSHTIAGPKGDREQWRSNVWVGPEDSFTPIHRDPYENLFIQVVGSKRLHIFPPHVSHLLSLAPGAQSNTSLLQTEDVLLGNSATTDAAMRDITSALQNEDTCTVTMGPGDALYIPRGWFHCVRALSVSASVNYWFR